MLDEDYELRLRSPTKKLARAPIGSDQPTSSTSPQRRKLSYGDRFIPQRSATNFELSFIQSTESAFENMSESASATYAIVLRKELLGDEASTEKSLPVPTPPHGSPRSFLETNISTPPSTPPHPSAATGDLLASPSSSVLARSSSMGDPGSSPRSKVLCYKSPTKTKISESPFSLSPMSAETQQLLANSKGRRKRKIPKTPLKILEAPAIQDDFYLNLVDWSSTNILAVGLSSAVYLWNAGTGMVSRLCDFGSNASVTSVAWIERGTHLAVGSTRGTVQIWDVAREKRVRDLSGHKSRVGALAWNAHILTSGSRDRLIYHRDVRVKEPTVARLVGHKQEVCGLRWSPDGSYLASGGNDNKLLIWPSIPGGASSGASSVGPVHRFADHMAAVKAIAWSPHQRGLLASGGGTADRCIRFWNVLAPPTSAEAALGCVETGSQVCNLAWSRNVNELVSTHGYSQNQIVVWSFPSMAQLATLTGHTMRVLYLAISPDGQTIVTGAGDETLRFWNVFPGASGHTPGVEANSMFKKLDIR